jgi:prevent-host-death family protein
LFLWIGFSMTVIGLSACQARLATLVDQVMLGEFVTITRHKRPVAVVVPVEAARIAREALRRKRGSLVECLRRFPGVNVPRNTSPSRDVLL